jgi:hypothetical protein
MHSSKWTGVFDHGGVLHFGIEHALAAFASTVETMHPMSTQQEGEYYLKKTFWCFQGSNLIQHTVIPKLHGQGIQFTVFKRILILCCPLIPSLLHQIPLVETISNLLL